MASAILAGLGAGFMVLGGGMFVVQALACSSTGWTRARGDARDRSRREGASCPRAHARGYDISSPAGTVARPVGSSDIHTTALSLLSFRRRREEATNLSNDAEVDQNRGLCTRVWGILGPSARHFSFSEPGTPESQMATDCTTGYWMWSFIGCSALDVRCSTLAWVAASGRSMGLVAPSRPGQAHGHTRLPIFFCGAPWCTGRRLPSSLHQST
jgi:hypothetical protein